MMKGCWVLVLTIALSSGLTASLPAQKPSPTNLASRIQAGFIVVPVSPAEEGRQLKVVPYHPQAGDLLLYDYANRLYTMAFKAVGTGTPIHSAIVFHRPDGSPALLDLTGPKVITAKVCLFNVEPRLRDYHGSVLVRRVRHPLSAERSAALTQFALAQEDKPFAVGRLVLQGTPLRPRTGIRRQLFGHTELDRQRWICSELTVAAATVAGLLDPSKHFANSIYPRDLAYDENYDFSTIFQTPVLWVAVPNPMIDGDRVVVFREP
jgi:hypothetical protein